MAGAVRCYLTAGVAALGASAIALSPVQPLPATAVPAPQRATLAVDLAAAIDPITPWVTTIKTSLQNATALPALYLQQPLPILTTIARNQLTYLKELPDIGLIASQTWGNVKIFFNGPWQPVPELISDAQVTEISGFPISQQTVYGLLLTDASDQLDPLIEFAASPVSGEILGFLGPVISPLIQLTQSFTAIGQFFQAGNVLGAINELINIPANVTNAFLNGGKYLDLTGVAKTLGLDLPPEVTRIGFNMGGLLNVSPRAYEPPTLPGSDVHPYGGGVAFDAVAGELQQSAYNLRAEDGNTLSIVDPGWPVGAIAPVIGLGQALADAMLVSEQTEAFDAAASTRAVAPAATEVSPIDVPAAVPDIPTPVPAVPDISTKAPAPAAASAPHRRGRPAASHAPARGIAKPAAGRTAG